MEALVGVKSGAVRRLSLKVLSLVGLARREHGVDQGLIAGLGLGHGADGLGQVIVRDQETMQRRIRRGGLTPGVFPFGLLAPRAGAFHSAHWLSSSSVSGSYRIGGSPLLAIDRATLSLTNSSAPCGIAPHSLALH